MNKLKLLPIVLCLVLAGFGNGLFAKTILKEGSGAPSNTELTSVVTDPSDLSSACTVAVPPVINSNGPSTICQGGHVHLTTGNYAHYHWNTGSNNAAINAFFTGTYSVTVTDNNGCTGVASISVVVHPRPHPVIHLHGPFNLCSGGEVLDAGAGYSSYAWSNGASTQMTNPTTIGWYSCTVTNQWGCTGVAYRFVIVLPNPTVSITQTGTLSCANSGSVNLTANGSFGVTGYSWDNSANTASITVTSAGTYCVTATSFWGCTASACQTVTGGNNSISCSITPSGSTSFCAGGSVILDAGAFASYLWSDGSMNQTLTATASGTYCVTVTDAGGCTCVACIDVNVTTVASPTITLSSPPIFCNGGNVSLDAGTWSSYNWSDGESTESIIIYNGGNYCVTVTDANGCTASACSDVIANPVPNPSVTASGATTFCDGGSVVITADTWDNYSWSPNGETTGSITATSTGTYCVIVTDADGCTGSACIDVTVNPNPQPTISGSTSACAGSCVTLDAGSWSSYSWTDGTNGEFSTVCSSGQNCVTVTDGNGCVGSTCVDVTIYNNPTPSISGNTTACAGSCVTLDAGSYAGYSWSSGDVSETILACSTGNYSVTVSDDNGCFGSANIAVTIYDNPVVTAGDVSGCEGNNITLLGSPAGGSWDQANPYIGPSTTYTYTYIDGNGCSGQATSNITVNANPTVTAGDVSGCDGTSITLLGSPAGGTWDQTNPYSGPSATYTYSYTDGNGCSGQATSNITVNANPTVTAGDVSGCAGSNITLLGSPAGGTWNQANPYTGPSASYTYSYTDGNGCSGQATSNITVNANPTVAAGDVSGCAGSNIALLGSPAGGTWNQANPYSGPSASYTYSYTDGNGCSGSATSNIAVNLNPTVSAGDVSGCAGSSITLLGSPAGGTWNQSNPYNGPSASYTYSYTDGNGCSGSATSTITVNANPTPSISGPSASCSGSLTLSTGTFASYSWNNGGGNAQSATYTTSGTECVTVTDAHGCHGSACQAITVNTASTNCTISGPTTVCTGSGNQPVTLTASSGSAYLWSTGATSPSINVTASGNYSCTITDAAGCTCVAHHAVTYISFTNPVISGTTFTCNGGSVTLSVTTSYDTYAWSSGGATTQSISVNTSGTYVVTVTQGVCSATANRTVTIGTSPIPNITANGPTTFCTGSSVTLSAFAGGGATYAWSNGATGQSSGVITTSGTYTVTATNVLGCTGSASQVVTVNNFITPTITANVPASCTQTSLALNAGSGYASYSWSTTEVTQLISVTGSGIYSVTVTNTNGCSGVASFDASVFCPKVVTSITGATTGCGSVPLTCGPGAAYLWSNGGGLQTINATSTAVYGVTVTNACGCTGTASRATTVSVSATANLVATGLATYCSGTSNATLTVTSNAHYIWSTGATSNSIQVAPGNPGTYCVTVTNTNGCTASSCATLSTACILPSNITTISITSNSAYGQWVQPGCVSGYTMSWRKQGTLTWTTATILPNSHYTFSQLLQGTCYDWTVQTNCSATTNSGPSAIQYFCTPPTARMAGEVDAITSFNVYPNPTSDHATINFFSQDIDMFTVKLVDVTGRTIMSEVHQSTLGDNQVEIGLSSVAKGIYFVTVEKADQRVQSKLVVQ